MGDGHDLPLAVLEVASMKFGGRNEVLMQRIRKARVVVRGLISEYESPEYREKLAGTGEDAAAVKSLADEAALRVLRRHQFPAPTAETKADLLLQMWSFNH